jgi:hypothetical protein
MAPVAARIFRLAPFCIGGTHERAVSTRHATRELVELEVVATSPCRIKSPAFCGFSPKSRARGRIRTCTVDALDIVSLLVGLREQKEMEPPAGDAPAGILYKRNPQAAALRPAA